MPGGRDLLVSTSDALGHDPQSQVWSLATLRPVTPLLTGGDASWSPDGRLVITTGTDGNARVWDAVTGLEVLTLKGHTNWVVAVAYSPDGRLLASAGFDGTVKVWDAATGRLLADLKRHVGPVNAVTFTPDSRHLASGGEDEAALVWDVGPLAAESPGAAQAKKP